MDRTCQRLPLAGMSCPEMIGSPLTSVPISTASGYFRPSGPVSVPPAKPPNCVTAVHAKTGVALTEMLSFGSQGADHRFDIAGVPLRTKSRAAQALRHASTARCSASDNALAAAFCASVMAAASCSAPGGDEPGNNDCCALTRRFNSSPVVVQIKAPRDSRHRIGFGQTELSRQRGESVAELTLQSRHRQHSLRLSIAGVDEDVRSGAKPGAGLSQPEAPTSSGRRLLLELSGGGERS